MRPAPKHPLEEGLQYINSRQGTATKDIRTGVPLRAGEQMLQLVRRDGTTVFNNRPAVLAFQPEHIPDINPPACRSGSYRTKRGAIRSITAP
jgi:hypothetical protein